MGGVGYESWFLSARDPEARRGLWIRRNVRTLSTGAAVVAHWFTTFAPDPVETRQLCRIDDEPIGFRAGPEEFVASVATGEERRSWSLRVAASEPSLRPLRPPQLYRCPVPRTKVEIAVPDGAVAGDVDLGTVRWLVRGWAATVGHSWGSEHADRWIWIHAARLDGAVRWLDVALGRERLGGVLTPWQATGAARIRGRLVPLGGLGRRSWVAVLSPAHARVRLAIPGGRLDIDVEAAHQPAAVIFRDPGGGLRQVAHSGLANVRMGVGGCHELVGRSSGTGCATLEIGSRDRLPGLTRARLPLEG
jgi:hypothetical protein